MDEEALIKKTLEDFGVDSEDELYEKLSQESTTIPCIICRKEKAIDKIIFKDSDPYCKKCLNEGNYIHDTQELFDKYILVSEYPIKSRGE